MSEDAGGSVGARCGVWWRWELGAGGGIRGCEVRELEVVLVARKCG